MNTNYNKEIVGELANAIVAQACEDYRNLLRGNCDNPDEMRQDLMTFFGSEWYHQLTKVDHQFLLDTLKKEWEEGKKLIASGRDVDCPILKKKYEFKCPLCGGIAETHIRRVKCRKRKDGSQVIRYYKQFTCSCHRPEEILLRQEVIAHEDNKNKLTERS